MCVCVCVCVSVRVCFDVCARCNVLSICLYMSYLLLSVCVCVGMDVDSKTEGEIPFLP